jgi:hypothetical protein
VKYALLISVLSIALLSCSNDPVDDPAKQQALTTGTWKLTGHVRDYQKDGTYEEDTYAMFDGCLKDNFYTFQSDGTAITDEGAVKCYSTNPQTTTSSWSFSDNQTRFQFGGIDYQIEELTAATLRLKGSISYNVIYTINVKSTYTKQ